VHPISPVLRLEALSEKVIGAAIEVHRALGPGLLESAYVQCLAFELTERGVGVAREVPMAVEYKGVRLDCGYRADLIVAGQVLVEVKSVKAFTPIHGAQLLTYLRVAKLPVGLLMNFNVNRMADGILRRVL